MSVRKVNIQIGATDDTFCLELLCEAGNPLWLSKTVEGDWVLMCHCLEDQHPEAKILQSKDLVSIFEELLKIRQESCKD